MLDDKVFCRLYRFIREHGVQNSSFPIVGRSKYSVQSTGIVEIFGGDFVELPLLNVGFVPIDAAIACRRVDYDAIGTEAKDVTY